MPDKELFLKWFYDRKGKVTYSMDRRLGPSSYDCSSSVYLSLKQGGYLPVSFRVGNTDTLFRDLESNGWSQLQPNAQGNFDTQRGDIFIWGVRGASGGGAGHTGAFVDADNVIHCSYGYNGIHVDNYDWLRSIQNPVPTQTFYRYTGASAPAPTNAVDQVIEVGSLIKFDKVFTADDVQLIDGVWQVRTNKLCPVNFTWADNGIPVAPLVEVDSDGFATPDQELAVGSLYKLPGRFAVQDVGQDSGVWLALIEHDGLKFWVNIEPATEIPASDAGTSVPTTRPQPAPVEPTPEPTPEPVQPPVVPVPETPIVDTPTPPVVNIPKEEEMAFSKEQQSELSVATQSVLDSNDFAPIISDKVKTVAYFATDIAAILVGFVLTLLAIFHVVNAVDAITVNATVVSALLGLKHTFRVSSKKQ